MIENLHVQRQYTCACQLRHREDAAAAAAKWPVTTINLSPDGPAALLPPGPSSVVAATRKAVQRTWQTGARSQRVNPEDKQI